jgi:ketohexokinase
MTGPGRVLGVGIATVDIVNRVATYPPEDAEVRALDQRIARGGNAVNTLAVLRQLGCPCAWIGTLADDGGAALIRADFGTRGIDIANAVTVAGAATPTSYIALSQATGSRTIIHHRDLPELGAADFAKVPLGDCAWVHFEGRHPSETRRMIERIHRERPDLPLSVEIEKPRPGIEDLLRTATPRTERGARVLIFSRAYAEAIGEGRDARRFLAQQADACDAELLIAPWGADGAYGLLRGSASIHAPAHPPAAVVDTLAAGDVFNGALIDGLLARDLATLDDRALAAILGRANRIAGHGCGLVGLDGLVTSARAAGLLR